MTVCRDDDCTVALSKNALPTCVDRERLCESARREYLRLFAKLDCHRSRQSEIPRLVIGAFAARARFGGVHKIQAKSFQATLRQPHAEAVPISPFIGFQYTTVETLERFRWWR